MSALAFALCFAAWLTFAVTGFAIGANPPLGAAFARLALGCGPMMAIPRGLR